MRRKRAQHVLDRHARRERRVALGIERLGLAMPPAIQSTMTASAVARAGLAVTLGRRPERRLAAGQRGERRGGRGAHEPAPPHPRVDLALLARQAMQFVLSLVVVSLVIARLEVLVHARSSPPQPRHRSVDRAGTRASHTAHSRSARPSADGRPGRGVGDRSFGCPPFRGRRRAPERRPEDAVDGGAHGDGRPARGIGTRAPAAPADPCSVPCRRRRTAAAD